MEAKKRVYCLYRVSTFGQVDHDDIPMQKQACREFADRQGWAVVKEFYEKGVSGFKVSSKKRDAILEIQREAALGNFDILLVFMFDRLGRKDDETPFVVEWFVRHNVAVWSVNEGEQRFDSHVDKLLNYIHYWQASGESEKMSLRIKAGQSQVTREGHYPGGTCPFGYRLEKSGRFNNKKGIEVLDYVVDDETAVNTVKSIFDMYVNERYGAIRLVQYLNEQGVKRSNGKPLSVRCIHTMLQNELYAGYLCYGDVRTFVPALQIIDGDTFSRAQEIRKARRDRKLNCESVSEPANGESLLAGIIFCGHCGGRLAFIKERARYRKTDGKLLNKESTSYYCGHGINNAGTTCQRTYSSKRADDIVKSVIRQVLARIREQPPANMWERQHERKLLKIRGKVKIATRNAAKLDKELSAYKDEVIKVIQGDSAFSAEVLNQLISESEDKVAAQAIELDSLTSEMRESEALFEKIKGEHAQIRSWSEIFDESSIETQKLVAATLIREVRLSRGYRIEIDFNISAKEFLESTSFVDESLTVLIEQEKKETEGLICPRCGSGENQKSQGHNNYGVRKLKCGSCNRHYTLTYQERKYSDELRQQVVSAYEAGMRLQQVCDFYGVKKTSVYRWVKEKRNC